MKSISYYHSRLSGLLIIAILSLASFNLQAQPGPGSRIRFGVHADPIICWFGSDNSVVTNEGSRPGFNFGVSLYKYFGPNYSISTGINIISAGGRLASSDTTIFYLSHGSSSATVNVKPGNSIVYKIQYLSVPLGLKLQTNQIGYYTFFTDIGVDPKVVIGGKADIPSLSIKNENAMDELKMFNLSYHITAGVEYGIGGTTAFVLGIGFDNNFLDITKDRGNQPTDKISHKLLSFRLGVNF
ncbi:MAG: porin family protein [Bacteroidales bacterium]